MGGIYNPRYYHRFLLESGTMLCGLLGRWAIDGKSCSIYDELWPKGVFQPGAILSVKLHLIHDQDEPGIFIRTTGSNIDLQQSGDWIEIRGTG